MSHSHNEALCWIPDMWGGLSDLWIEWFQCAGYEPSGLVTKCTTSLHQSWKNNDFVWWLQTTPAGIFGDEGELLQYGHCNLCNSTLARHVNEQGEAK